MKKLFILFGVVVLAQVSPYLTQSTLAAKACTNGCEDRDFAAKYCDNECNIIHPVPNTSNASEPDCSDIHNLGAQMICDIMDGGASSSPAVFISIVTTPFMVTTGAINTSRGKSFGKKEIIARSAPAAGVYLANPSILPEDLKGAMAEVLNEKISVQGFQSVNSQLKSGALTLDDLAREIVLRADEQE